MLFVKNVERLLNKIYNFMTPTKKIIKEFEEMFLNNSINGVLDDKFQDEKMMLIKDFILSSLHQVATEAIEAVKLEKRGIHSVVILSDFKNGYNSAITDMEQKAKKFLEDNF